MTEQHTDREIESIIMKAVDLAEALDSKGQGRPLLEHLMKGFLHIQPAKGTPEYVLWDKAATRSIKEFIKHWDSEAEEEIGL